MTEDRVLDGVVIPELEELAALQRQVGREFLAAGFEIDARGRGPVRLEFGHARSFSDDPRFWSRLPGFATANGSGSRYALWRGPGGDEPVTAALPVVVSGDEGGLHVVARNLPELFQLLGADAWLDVDWNEADYYWEDDWTSPGHGAFVEWLDRRFGLAPAEDPAAVVAAAQAEHGPAFAGWARAWVPDVAG